MNHRSLAFRLTVWYAVLLSAAFALAGITTYFGVEEYLRANLADSLQRRTAQVQKILQTATVPLSVATISSAIETQITPAFANRFVRITLWPDALVYRSDAPANHSFDPKLVAPPVVWPQQFKTRRVTMPGGGPLLVGSVRYVTAGGDYLIELGSSLEPIEAVRDRLLILLGLLLPVLVLLAAAGGYLLVDRALRPVDEMSHTAAQISIKDLDARLPVLPTGDALQRLSVSLNHMLGRLRESVQTSQRFLADASHELRTPLTIIKGELEEIVAAPHCEPEAADRVGSVLEEVGRLQHLIEGLLVLSRLDAGEAQRELVHVDLSELVVSTAEQMRLVAEDRGIQLELSIWRPVLVRGDRGRLKQVIVNLLDNAIRFTPRGGAVTLLTDEADSYILLEVRDTGIGIPAGAIPHVFDRFFRVDDARSREDGGAGLGLSIVKSICAAHDAEIDVDSHPGQGSCFRLKFRRPSVAAGLPQASAPQDDSGVFDSKGALRRRVIGSPSKLR
ncbi:MAG TPA: ATP-binding protein [Steroidobacteraceae bacterium]